MTASSVLYSILGVPPSLKVFRGDDRAAQVALDLRELVTCRRG